MAVLPQPDEATAAAERLLQALDMWEDGVQIKRESLRRRWPRATSDEIEAEVARWLAEPDLVDEDHVIVPWPRRPR
jgi:hypothetical protein